MFGHIINTNWNLVLSLVFSLVTLKIRKAINAYMLHPIKSTFIAMPLLMNLFFSFKSGLYISDTASAIHISTETNSIPLAN
jgi:hypothetical protein